jgi:hypothetical protein
LVRVDRNDYSIDPRFAGRRIEVRVSQNEVLDHMDRRSERSIGPVGM